jgi:small ligand-binding sensory domain FIST
LPFAVALSEHPLAAHATGEVVGRVLEVLGPAPELAVLLVGGSHRHQFAQIADAVRATLAPAHLVGATALGVLAGEREVEDHAALVLWAGSARPLATVRLDPVRPGGSVGVLDDQLDPGAVAAAETLLLLAAPDLAVDAAATELADRYPHLQVAGAVVGAGPRPGDTRLVADEAIRSTGGIGVLLAPSDPVRVLVSPGCRPIGSPLVVTEADGRTIVGLAGRPVLDRVDEALLALDRADQEAAAAGLHLGVVVDERRAEFGPGDFRMVGVTDVDRARRTLSVAEAVPVGTTVQLQLRDADAADHDLRATLAGNEAAGALVFAGAGRGARLFGDPDHDAQLVATVVDHGASAGVFGTRLLGPPAVHAIDDTRSTVVALFDPR